MRQPDPSLFLAHHPEVTRLVGELPKAKIIAVLLFGSSVTRKTGPLSDIDICIVTGDDLSAEEREVFHSFASRSIHLSLFTDLPPGVQFRVVRDGHVLFCADELALHRAKIGAVRAYLSTKPLIERNIDHVLR